MSDFVEVCEKAARAGGEVLLDWQGRFAVTEKGPTDLVTEADLASQQRIREIVLQAFPDHEFLGEEDDFTDRRSDVASPYRWLVDPLDGTTNYVHQFPMYSVSVALEKAGKIVAATVYDPANDHCFVAEAGRGARLNGRDMQVSQVSRMHEALVAASFGYQCAADSDEVARFLRVLPVCQAVRRLGSAALNLCFVATGQIDAYWATSAKIWDIAAGALILQEAGGVITAIDGGPLDLEHPQFAAAATRPLHGELVELLG